MKVPSGPIGSAKPAPDNQVPPYVPPGRPSQTDLLMAAATMHSMDRLFEKPTEPKPTDDK